MLEIWSEPITIFIIQADVVFDFIDFSILFPASINRLLNYDRK